MRPTGAYFPPLPVNELLVHYLQFAATYYVRDGQPTGEIENIKDAMRPLRKLYGSTAAAEFGPRAIKLVREHLIREGRLSRRVLNSRIDRIKRIFRWAVSEGLVPPSVYEGLRTVSGLRLGRCDAREPAPVRPVSDQCVEAALPLLLAFCAPPAAVPAGTGASCDHLAEGIAVASAIASPPSAKT